MILCNLKTNHVTTPMGYDLSHISFSWIVKEAKGKR